jgi:hypothetical protein
MIACHADNLIKPSQDTGGRWTGDVWKAIVEYRTRSNLNIFTCLIDMGISIIQVKNNENLLNLETKNFKKLKFKDFLL